MFKAYLKHIFQDYNYFSQAIKGVFIFILSTIISTPAFSQTTIPDGTTLTGTLPLSNSPYIVDGLVSVLSGETLTIEPGVELRFKTGTDYDYSGDGTVNVGHMYIKGKLIAEGTATDNIIFTRDGSSGNWGCVAFHSTADETSSLKYCKIEYADRILSLESTNYNGALSVKNPGLTIHNCSISNNNYNGIYTDYCSPEIINCIIANNQSQGINLNFNGAGTTYIVNSTISGNQHDGLGTTINDSEITNCIFWNNTSSFNLFGGNCDISFSLVQEDVLFDDDLTQGAGMIYNFDPQLDTDFSTPLNSPCINAGIIDETNYTLPLKDFWNNDRIYLTDIDIGASESPSDDYIHLITPNGSEGLFAGNNQDITWKTNAANVKLEYSTDNGSNWTDIVASTTNDGLHPWTAPSTESTLYDIRISDASNASVYDRCDVNFTVFSSIIPDSTTISGTLTLANSPYSINGLVIVPSGETLTIEPGVELRFKTGADYDYSGDDSVNVGHMFIKGKLIAEGTASDNITFTRDGASGNWGCIAFHSTADETSSLKYCSVEFANRVLSLESTYYNGALSVKNPGLTIHNCSISNNNYSGIYTDYCSPEIINCIISNNQNQGIYLSFNGAGTTYIVNCTISENQQEGLGTSINNSEITNCIFWNNTSSFNFFGGSCALSYSLVQEDVLSDDDLTQGAGMIYSFDPQLDTDFSTPLNSPCINAGIIDESNYTLPLKDFWDNDRIYLTDIDIGASESPSDDYIHLITPNGSEGLFAGNSQDITWKTNAANVKLEYSTDNGSNWTDIVASTTNDGLHPWTVPNIGSTEFDIRISDAGNSSVNDRCDGNFTVIYSGPAEELIAHYPFNNNPDDESGNGHDGTENGGIALVSDRYGNSNSAYNFNGTDSYITIPHSAEFDLSSYTLSAWIKPRSYPDVENGIVEKGIIGDPENHNYSLYMVNTSYFQNFYEYNSGANNVFCTSAKHDVLDQWYHILGSYDGAELKMYVNGRLEKTTVEANPPGTNPSDLVIGARNDEFVGYKFFFDGVIDEVKVYNRALTEFESIGDYGNYYPPDSLSLKSSNQQVTLCWDSTDWEYLDKVYIFRDQI